MIFRSLLPHKRILLLAVVFLTASTSLLLYLRSYYGVGSGYSPKEYRELTDRTEEKQSTYKASLRTSPPSDYLIPPPNFMPIGYQFVEQAYREKSVRYHYYKDKNNNDIIDILDSGYSLEKNTLPFEKYIREIVMGGPDKYRIDKEFSYKGFPGVAIAYSYFGLEEGAKEYWIYYNYEGRLITLYTTDKKFCNPTSLYNILTTLIPSS